MKSGRELRVGSTRRRTRVCQLRMRASVIAKTGVRVQSAELAIGSSAKEESSRGTRFELEMFSRPTFKPVDMLSTSGLNRFRPNTASFHEATTAHAVGGHLFFGLRTAICYDISQWQTNLKSKSGNSKAH